MKKIQILIAIAFVITTLSSNVFAVETNIDVRYQNGTVDQNTGFFKDHGKHDKCDKCHKDPIKRLEEKKQSIQKELKEGRISKEKADEMTREIDEHIQKIKEFNSLPLPQKKEKMYSRFQSHIENNVKAGKITKEEGEKLLTEFKKELDKWDGKGYLKIVKKDKKPD